METTKKEEIMVTSNDICAVCELKFYNCKCTVGTRILNATSNAAVAINDLATALNKLPKYIKKVKRYKFCKNDCKYF